MEQARCPRIFDDRGSVEIYEKKVMFCDKARPDRGVFFFDFNFPRLSLLINLNT